MYETGYYATGYYATGYYMRDDAAEYTGISKDAKRRIQRDDDEVIALVTSFIGTVE